MRNRQHLVEKGGHIEIKFKKKKKKKKKKGINQQLLKIVKTKEKTCFKSEKRTILCNLEFKLSSDHQNLQ